MENCQFQEKINYNKLIQVINCCNIPQKVSDDENWSSKILPTILKTIKNQMDKDNNTLQTKYKQRITGTGRLYSNFGLQRINNDIKCYISGEYYNDLDIVNCHPVIIYNLFKKNKIHNDFIQSYVEDREACMKKYNLKDKKELITIINIDQMKPYYHKDICDFHFELYNNLFKNIMKGNLSYYQNLKKSITKRLQKDNLEIFNIVGKMLSVYLQTIENDLLGSIINFFESKNIPIDVLMFDGAMIQKEYNLPEELLNECCDFVKSKTDYTIKLKLKPMVTDWIPEEGVVEQEAPLYNLTDNFSIRKLRELCEKYWIFDKTGTHIGISYEAPLVVEYLNLFCCQFQNPISYGFRNNVRDSYRFLTINDIAHISKSSSPLSKMYPACYIWYKNIDSLVYDKTDFIVDFKNNDVINEVWEDTQKSKGLTIYNLYKRPESIPTLGKDIETICKIFFDFLKEIICDNDEELFIFLKNWIGYILQHGKTGIALVLMGRFGTGKGTLANILTDLIGAEYCITDACGSRINSNFNAHEEAKLLCVLEELPNTNGENHLKAEKMKQKITDKQTLIEKKGIDVYSSTNNCNFIMNTNGQNPVRLEKDQRRYTVFKINPAREQDTGYFTSLRKIVKENKFYLRDYFQNLEVSFKDMKVIETRGNKDLLELNKSSIDSFTEDYLPIFIKQFYKIKAKDLYHIYNSFALLNKYTNKPTQYKYFKDFIKNKTQLDLVEDKNRTSWFSNGSFKDTKTIWDENKMDMFFEE